MKNPSEILAALLFLTGNLCAQPDLLISEFNPVIKDNAPLQFVEIYNTSTTATIDLTEDQCHIIIFNNTTSTSIFPPIALNGTIPPESYFVIGQTSVDNTNQTAPSLFTGITSGAIAIVSNLDPETFPVQSSAINLENVSTILDACYFASRFDNQSSLPEILGISGFGGRFDTMSELGTPSPFEYSIQRPGYNSTPGYWFYGFLGTPSPGVANTNPDYDSPLPVGSLKSLLSLRHRQRITLTGEFVLTATYFELCPALMQVPLFLQQDNTAVVFNSASASPSSSYTSITGTFSDLRYPILDSSSEIKTDEVFQIIPLPITTSYSFELPDLFRLAKTPTVFLNTSDTTFEEFEEYELFTSSGLLPVKLKIGRFHESIGQRIPPSLTSLTGLLIQEESEMGTELFLYPRNLQDMGLTPDQNVTDEWRFE